eukprot:334607-Rhodomonas_salina.1
MGTRLTRGRKGRGRDWHGTEKDGGVTGVVQNETRVAPLAGGGAERIALLRSEKSTGPCSSCSTGLSSARYPATRNQEGLLVPAARARRDPARPGHVTPG